MPTGRTKEELSKIISSLSKKYNSPMFKPHVTLTGGFTGDEKKLLKKTEELSKMLKPLTVHLGRASYLDEFFRSLFILVERTPELMDACETARMLFGISEDDFVPHMSLVYGNFSAEEKERMIKQTGREFNIKFTADKIHFVFNNEQQLKWPEIAAFPLK